jgi:large subunit ribosomal protein L29
MKAKDMNTMTKEQLEAQVSELKTELFNLRFQLATGQLSNPKKITEVKRDIARAKTVIRLKEQA